MLLSSSMACAIMLILGFLLEALLVTSSAINPDLCNSTDTVDCSNQFGLPKESGCVISPTSICKTMKLSSTPPLKKLISEDDAPFEISLSPYLLTHKPWYGMNFTLKSHDKDITAFFFNLHQHEQNYNSCRVFDFTEVKRVHPEQEANLNYNCYTGFQEFSSRHYNITVRATPINQELNYWVYMPSLYEIESAGTCDWVPLAVLNTAAVSEKIIDLKFSSNNSDNVTYSVMLLSNTSESIKAVVPKPDMEVTMHRVVFKDVPSGLYDVAIVPVLEDSACDQKVLFTVSVPIVLVAPICPWVYAVVAVAVFVVVVIILGLFVRFQNVKDLPKPKVLMLYSEDCPAHMNLVMKYYEFLNNCCNMHVSIDKWDLRNQAPEDWISNVVQAAEVVIIIMSKGVEHKLNERENEPKMTEDSPWGNLFTPTFRSVKSRITYHTTNPPPPKVVSVIFTSYTKCNQIPEEIRNIGKVFRMPVELNQFLCYIHKVKTMGLYRFRPIMPGSRYLLYRQGKQWEQALTDMITYQNANPGWFQTRINGAGVNRSISRESSSVSESEAHSAEQVELLHMNSEC